MKAARRKFLKAGALAMAAGNPLGWLNAALLPAAPENGEIHAFHQPGNAEDIFDSRTYARFLRTTFQVRLADNQRTYLTLAEVEDLPTTSSMAGPVFALRFTIPRHMEFPQGICRFEHPQLGQFDFFIAPIGRPSPLTMYEAIINREQGASNADFNAPGA
jgi:hypothetical protein